MYDVRRGGGYVYEESISRVLAVELFDLDGVVRSRSSFDLKKLENLIGHYIREAENTRLASLVAPRIAAILGRELDEADLALLNRAMESLKPRAKNLNELAEGAVFLFKNRPLDLDEKAASLLDDAARVLLGKTRAALSDVQEWSPTALDEKVRGVAEDAEIGLGKVAQPLRAALTGRATSPGIFDVLFLLGKDKSDRKSTRLNSSH